MSVASPDETVLEFLFTTKASQRRQFLLELRNVTLFAVAYLAAYACARYFAQRTATRLWLPDSILLCALLLVPRKKWWLYLLATTPTRFVPELRPNVAAWFLWATWLNDVAKAMLAAWLLQKADCAPMRFNSVRRYASYLGIAVMLAPLLSGFFGALTRLTLGHAFWPAWGQWTLGDALANLVVTPTLLLWFSREYQRLRARLFEVTVWALGFALCLYYTVRLTSFSESLIVLYAPFPFLIWAAARLGPIGASSGLSLASVFIILGISQHKGPFAAYPIARDMHFLQLFLAVLALPILFVATLFEERQLAVARLREQQEELNRNYERTRKLAAGLIQAQENERRRIGRELHDDVGQRVALLVVGLDRLSTEPSGNVDRERSLVSDLRCMAEEVAQSLRAVAHQLHSSTLQHLGLVKALQGLCRTFSQQYQVKVKLEAQPLQGLPDAVNLCLFRLAQEALNNAVKHGRADSITVTLTRTGELLRLQIEDTGTGFDPAAVSDGLGLVSMRERLRMVGGTLVIQSSPGEGTVIEAVLDSASAEPR